MGSHTGTNVASVLGGTLGLLLPPGGAFLLLLLRLRGVDTVCDSLCRGGRGRGIAYVTVCSFLLQQNSRSPSPFIQLPFPPPLSPPPPSVRPSVPPFSLVRPKLRYGHGTGINNIAFQFEKGIFLLRKSRGIEHWEGVASVRKRRRIPPFGSWCASSHVWREGRRRYRYRGRRVGARWKEGERGSKAKNRPVEKPAGRGVVVGTVAPSWPTDGRTLSQINAPPPPPSLTPPPKKGR